MLRPIALASALLVAAVSPVSAQPRGDVYSSLELIADAAARLNREMCVSDQGRVFQAGLEAINAMPERAGKPPIPVVTPYIETFAEAYGAIYDNGEHEPEILERAVIAGMVRAIDPGGQFLRPSELRASPRPGGVMVNLTRTNGAPTVINALPDGPAALGGVLPGDRIVAINGEPMRDKEMWQVVDGLRGDIGSSVTLTLERNSAQLEVTLVRVDSRQPPATWRVVDGVGVVTIAGMTEHAGAAVRDAIRSIREETRNVRGYVVDLRDNAGGLLDQVIEVEDQFIDMGWVMSVRPYVACRNEPEQRYNTRRGDETEGAPLVVLINGDTASGAEHLAAALRERRNATLIGQRTLGNGRVHTVVPLHNRQGMAYLKITTGILLTPNGASWDSEGVAPDIVTEPATAASDPAMDAALARLRAP